MKVEKHEDTLNILDYLIILAKRKRLVISFTLLITVTAIIYSLTLPNIYRAETRVLSPKGSNKSSLLLKELGNIMGISGHSEVFGGPSAIIGIIQSRTIYDRIIDRFGLMDIYKAEYREIAREKLDSKISVINEKMSQIITIEVLNEDPKLAADIANALIEELIDLLQGIAITEASQRRLFFEEKMKQIKEDLIKSEEAMTEFQIETGVLKVEEQARAVIESIANLRAQMAAKEVELKVMKTYSTANNPDLQIIQETLKGLKNELKKFEKTEGSDPDPLMPTGRMPGVGKDYVRKLRDLKFNESLFEIMAKQYEIARIDEAQDPAIIQVIDTAVPPEKKFKPHRAIIITVVSLAGFFFALLLAFFVEHFEEYRSRGNEYGERLEILKKYLSLRRKN